MTAAVTAGLYIRIQCVGSLVFFNQLPYTRFLDRRDAFDEVPYPVAVRSVAEGDLGSDFIPLGYGNLPHVVAEAGHLHRLLGGAAEGRARPGCELAFHLRPRKMSYNNLAPNTQSGAEVPELPVAVGALVEVHVVHVDAAVGQVAVELGVEVAEGFA